MQVDKSVPDQNWNVWKTPSQTHKRVRGGVGLSYTVLGVKMRSFLWLAKQTGLLPVWPTGTEGETGLGSLKGEAKTEYIPSHSLNTTTAFGMEHFEPAQQNSIS